MPATFLPRLSSLLSRRSSRGLLRSLPAPPPPGRADLSTNDYLSLASDPPPSRSSRSSRSSPVPSPIPSSPLLPPGSTGSRLLSGSHAPHSSFESALSAAHYPSSGASCALLFNSGYDLNLSLLSALPGPDDVVLLDEEIHNSVHMGVRMGRAQQPNVRTFRHNDVADLERQLRSVPSSAAGVFLCVESYYSMSGTVAPLRRIFGALAGPSLPPDLPRGALVDEAHASGVFGPEGLGLLQEAGLADHPLLLGATHTFGKAWGSHGAALLCPPAAGGGESPVIGAMLNFAKPLIYSTALAPEHAGGLEERLELLRGPRGDERRAALLSNVAEFRALFEARFGKRRSGGGTFWLPEAGAPGPIQGVRVAGGNEGVVEAARMLGEEGYR
ncbi:hypothetical protein TeGR_g4475, partial [Tetraparma gracilis]